MSTTDALFEIDGMHCASCGLLVDETVEDLDGVLACATDVRGRRARVTYDPRLVALEDIAAAIASLGYRTAPARSDGA